jgi:hypothetical protein
MKKTVEEIHQEIFDEVMAVPKQKENQALIRILKILLAIAALGIICLLLITYLGNGTFFEFLQGRITSVTVQDGNSITLKNGAIIIFQNNTVHQLDELFKQNQKTEFRACLVGKIIDNQLIVNGIYIPTTYDQTVYSVTSAVCDINTIISLHSHPVDHCVFSEQDIRSYEQYKNTNPDMILGLMCNNNRFSFYTK